MASIGSVTLFWGDEEHTFDLQQNRWMRELQTKTGFGPFKLMARLKSGEWFLDEVRHILRIGLLGAMTEPDDKTVNKIMAVQFDNRPIMQSLPLAITVLGAALYGGSEPTKKDRAEIDAQTEKTDASTSPLSMELAQP